MNFKITPGILLRAYSAGLFPMAESADDPDVHWVEPTQRGIIPLNGFHVPRSLAKQLRKKPFEIRIDTAFAQVIAACAEARPERDSTWINGTIQKLYTELHEMGHGHSVECWRDGKLEGGLYGLSLGGAFFGESMFSYASGASKIALVHLVARLKAGGFRLLDAQFTNPHLMQFGCRAIGQADYLDLLREALQQPADFHAFQRDADTELVLATVGS